MKKILILIIAVVALSACAGTKNEADAFGNFESDEIVISSENNGRIISASVAEGDKVQVNALMLLIDTTNLSLQKRQLISQKTSILSQSSTIQAQISVLDQQISNANKDLKRINKMLSEGAATAKQLDDITGQIDLVNREKEASISQVISIQKQAETVDAQITVLEDRMQAAVVRAPIKGTVLERYGEPGELAVPGKALFKMANVEFLNLRVYISETQLSQVKLGQTVRVLIDNGDDSKELKGKIQWIASEAEFTPKIIQTKEERVKLVYAVKVRVANDGSLKIGMPGEVVFK